MAHGVPAHIIIVMRLCCDKRATSSNPDLVSAGCELGVRDHERQVRVLTPRVRGNNFFTYMQLAITSD